MQVNVTIDIDKIDYDSINRQIKEKIEDMKLEKIFPFEDMFRNYLGQRINTFLDDYIGRKYGEDEASYKTREMVNDCMKEGIKEHIDESVDKFFEKIGHDELNKMIISIFPSILSLYLYNEIRMKASETYVSFQDSVNSITNSIITQRLNQLR